MRKTCQYSILKLSTVATSLLYYSLPMLLVQSSVSVVYCFMYRTESENIKENKKQERATFAIYIVYVQLLKWHTR